MGTCHWKKFGRKEGHCLELELDRRSDRSDGADWIGVREQTGSEEENRTDRSRQTSQTGRIRSDELPPN